MMLVFRKEPNGYERPISVDELSTLNIVELHQIVEFGDRLQTRRQTLSDLTDDAPIVSQISTLERGKE